MEELHSFPWKELDKKQKALAKLCLDTTKPQIGGALLDIVYKQHQGTGCTAALRTAEAESHRRDSTAAVCLIDCVDRGMYHSMNYAARSWGTCGRGYQDAIKNIVNAMAKSFGPDISRPVCIVFDHIGDTDPKRQQTVFRCADEAAYLQNMAVRLVFISNITWLWDFDKHKRVYAIPPRNELLYGRASLWDMSLDHFKRIKTPDQFHKVAEETPLFDGIRDDAAEVRRGVAVAGA